jgi:hypothetical protein
MKKENIFNLLMRDFFDERGRTRISAFGVLVVRRRLKFAENNAHRKKTHLEIKNYLALLAPSIPSNNCSIYQTCLSLAV